VNRSCFNLNLFFRAWFARRFDSFIGIHKYMQSKLVLIFFTSPNATERQCRSSGGHRCVGAGALIRPLTGEGARAPAIPFLESRRLAVGLLFFVAVVVKRLSLAANQSSKFQGNETIVNKKPRGTAGDIIHITSIPGPNFYPLNQNEVRSGA
jgi:hypothetical protein